MVMRRSRCTYLGLVGCWTFKIVQTFRFSFFDHFTGDSSTFPSHADVTSLSGLGLWVYLFLDNSLRQTDQNCDGASLSSNFSPMSVKRMFGPLRAWALYIFHLFHKRLSTTQLSSIRYASWFSAEFSRSVPRTFITTLHIHHLRTR